MASLIPPVILKATTRHTASLIFLHGLGDNGMGWAGALNTIRPPHLKVICPTAPIIPVTINGGATMPAWFDILSLDRNDENRADEEGLQRAADDLMGIVEAEVNQHKIPRDRILIGGFSQGGSVALHALLRQSEPLAGCLALSTFLSPRSEPEDRRSGQTQKLTTPILQCHGSWDEMIGIDWGRETHEMLRRNFEDVRFVEMKGMGHEANMEEMDIVGQFVKAKVPEEEKAKL